MWRFRINPGLHILLSGVVRELQAKLRVERRLILSVRLSDEPHQITDLLDHGSDLLDTDAPRGRNGLQLPLQAGTFTLRLVDPRGDLNRIPSSIECGAILAESSVTLRQAFAQVDQGRLIRVDRLLGHRRDHAFQPVRPELRPQPTIDLMQDLRFP